MLTRRAVALDEARAAAALKKSPPPARARRRSTSRSRNPSSSCSTRSACVHREWFKHLLYAPGFYTGYGVKTLPGVREAIEQAQYQTAPAEIARVGKALEREAAWLESLIKMVNGLK